MFFAMKYRSVHTLVALLCISIAAFGYVFESEFASSGRVDPSHVSSHQDVITNLRAFAKLYGYVRYFHPSDAAAEVDWERLAIHGARQIHGAETPAALKAELERLFAPIAPTIKLYPTGETPPSRHELLTPADTAGLQLVAWQHRGVGLGNQGPYRSIRLHRPGRSSQVRSGGGGGLGAISQTHSAAPYRGKQIRLRAALRTEGLGARAHLWLRIDRPDGQTGLYKRMADRPVSSETWDTYEISGTVDEDAENIVVGAFMRGSGVVYVDAIELSVSANGDSWTDIPIENAGFEIGTSKAELPGWNTRSSADHQFLQTSSLSYAGSQSLIIDSGGYAAVSGLLFTTRPAPGETVRKPLGRGIVAQIPLSLHSREGQTLRPSSTPAPSALTDELNKIDLNALSAGDAALRSGNVIIAWNVFQHFYPYFDVVDVDWDAVLTRTLRRAQDDQSSAEFLQTLRRMVAQLDDGHGNVIHPLQQEHAQPPIRATHANGKIVVTTVADSLVARDTACIQRGDVITAIGEVSASGALAEAKRHISGSPQLKEYQALIEMGRGPRGSLMRLSVRRGEERHRCTLHRSFKGLLIPDRPAPLASLEEGIEYVDLTRASMDSIQAKIQELADAKGVIFDLRGYPQGEVRGALQYLSSDTLRSTLWQVPSYRTVLNRTEKAVASPGLSGEVEGANHFDRLLQSDGQQPSPST